MFLLQKGQVSLTCTATSPALKDEVGPGSVLSNYERRALAREFGLPTRRLVVEVLEWRGVPKR